MLTYYSPMNLRTIPDISKDYWYGVATVRWAGPLDNTGKEKGHTLI